MYIYIYKIKIEGILKQIFEGHRLWHMKNKGVQQSHPLPQNSEAVDV